MLSIFCSFNRGFVCSTVTFVFHYVLIISTNACTGEVKFMAVTRDFFAKKKSHTTFLN